MEFNSSSSDNSSYYYSYDDLFHYLYPYGLWHFYSSEFIEGVRAAHDRMQTFSYFNLYFLPVMILVSFVGNSLVLIVVFHKKKRLTSTQLYIASLAIADLLVNCTSTLNEYLVTYGFVDRTYSTLDCKLRPVLSMSSRFASVWQLVVISTERALSVFIPHKCHLFCSFGTAKVSVIAVWTGSLLFGFCMTGVTYSKTVYLNTEITGLVCTLYEELYTFNFYLQNAVHVVLLFIPFTWILSCTVLTIILLVKNTTRSSQKSVTSSVTVMLIVLNIVFMLTQGPFHVFILLDEINYFGNPDDIVIMMNLTIVKTVTANMIDANSSLNFFVYFLSGSRFRNDLKSVLRCKTKVSSSLSDDTFLSSNRISGYKNEGKVSQEKTRHSPEKGSRNTEVV